MIKLYPYQHDAVNKLREGFNKHLRQILASPTGSGKTVIFSQIVRMVAEKGKQVVVLTDRTELFRQIRGSLERIQVMPILLNADTPTNTTPSGHVIICMVETLSRRSHILDSLKPDLIIIDEAHKGAFTKILEAFPITPTIGATATPIGKHIPKYYTSIVQNIDIPDLIEQGFLVRCKPYQMQDNFDDVKTKAGEFDDTSLYEHYDKKTLYDGVIREWLGKNNDRPQHRKTICFNVNIAHTEKMHQAWLEAGIRSAMITSKTPKLERAEILHDFTDGKYTILNNCGVLTTGYDEPSIECVIVNRATLSLALWLQMVGRGGRKYPNKAEFLLLDFGMNHKRHGLWSMPRKWTLEPEKKKRGADLLDIAPVKTCDNCGAMLPIMAKECEYCLRVFDMANKKLRNGILVEVLPDTLSGRMLSDMGLLELAELQDRGKPFSAPLIWRVVRSKGEEAVKEYCAIKKYSRGWIQRQIGELGNCNYRDMEIYPVE